MYKVFCDAPMYNWAQPSDLKVQGCQSTSKYQCTAELYAPSYNVPQSTKVWQSLALLALMYSKVARQNLRVSRLNVPKVPKRGRAARSMPQYCRKQNGEVDPLQPTQLCSSNLLHQVDQGGNRTEIQNHQRSDKPSDASVRSSAFNSLGDDTIFKITMEGKDLNIDRGEWDLAMNSYPHVLSKANKPNLSRDLRRFIDFIKDAHDTLRRRAISNSSAAWFDDWPIWLHVAIKCQKIHQSNPSKWEQWMLLEVESKLRSHAPPTTLTHAQKPFCTRFENHSSNKPSAPTTASPPIDRVQEKTISVSGACTTVRDEGSSLLKEVVIGYASSINCIPDANGETAAVLASMSAAPLTSQIAGQLSMLHQPIEVLLPNIFEPTIKIACVNDPVRQIITTYNADIFEYYINRFTLHDLYLNSEIHIPNWIRNGFPAHIVDTDFVKFIPPNTSTLHTSEAKKAFVCSWCQEERLLNRLLGPFTESTLDITFLLAPTAYEGFLRFGGVKGRGVWRDEFNKVSVDNVSWEAIADPVRDVNFGVEIQVVKCEAVDVVFEYVCIVQRCWAVGLQWVGGACLVACGGMLAEMKESEAKADPAIWLVKGAADMLTSTAAVSPFASGMQLNNETKAQ
ncbi:hypothetical protein BT69DRAFT_1297589 [Atractiella rhizophila]|nr:hypothetical protein BT69DRAFT_1297589 [Atractiella rhizophila]